jgi:hypothetical protein
VKRFLIFFFVPVVALSFNWKLAMENAEKGNVSLTPLNVVLVFYYHAPKSVWDGKIVSGIILEEIADLYHTLGKLRDGKGVIALSASFLDQMSNVERTRWTFFKYDPKILPPNLQGSSSENVWKVMVNSIKGKIIALFSSGNIDVAMLPLYNAPVVQLLENGFENHARDQISLSYEKLQGFFGKINTAVFPYLSFSPDVFDLLPRGVEYVVVDEKSVSRPVSYRNINFVPMDSGLSKELLSVNTEEDLSKVLSKLHRYQRAGREVVGIFINSMEWIEKDWETREGIISALLSDPFLKLSIPEDLNYSANAQYIQTSSIYGNPNNVFMEDSTLKLWELFKGIFVSYTKLSPYLSKERREEALDLLYSLEDATFYEGVYKKASYLQELLSLFDVISSRLYELIGENYSKLPKASEFVLGEVALETVEASPLINGLEDEGFWVYSKKFDYDDLELKLLGVENGLLVSIGLSEPLRSLIGKSFILKVIAGDTEYRFYLKTWRGRVYTFKNGKLNGKLEKGFGLWNVAEMLLRAELPLQFKVELVDSRTGQVIAQSSFLRLVKGR